MRAALRVSVTRGPSMSTICSRVLTDGVVSKSLTIWAQLGKGSWGGCEGPILWRGAHPSLSGTSE